MRSTLSKISALTTILILFFGFASAVGQDCDVETDEFSGEKEIECDRVDMMVEEHPGERLTSSRAMLVSIDGRVILMFYTMSESWNFISTDQAYGLIDGERFRWEFERIETGTTDYGSVEELHGIILTNDELSRLSNSDSFRFKVGGAVYDLSQTPVNEHAEELLSKL